MEKTIFSIPEKAKVAVTAEDVMSAANEGFTLSAYLNKREANNEALKATGLDAFDAALLSKGIIVKGNEKLNIQSSTMDVFFTTSENRLLFPEFMVRTIKQAIVAQPISQYLIGETQTITGDTMKQPVLDTSKSNIGKKNRENLHKRRIAEAAEIPVASLKLAEAAINVYKYGTGVKASYEVLRRTTIDMFRKTIELIGQYAAYDEVEEIVNMIIAGDGNNNPAQVYKRSELNANGNAGVLDEVTFTKLLIKTYPITLDTVVVGEELFLQLAQTLFDTNSGVGLAPYATFEMPQGILKGVTIIYDPELPTTGDGKNRLIALNKNLAVRKIIEQNSMIQELSNFANDQTKTMYITENAGFGKIYDEASVVLVVD